MSERARRRAFGVVCLLTAAVVALLTADGAKRQPPERASTAVETVPPRTPTPRTRDRGARAPSRRETDRLASAGPGSDNERPRRADQHGSAAFLRREKPRVLASAERFLGAYYAYDAGGRDAEVLARLREHSTPELTKRLLGAPAPRLPATMEHPPPPARVVAMSVEFDQPPTTALVRARTARGSRESVSGVVLRHARGRWRASQLTE